MIIVLQSREPDARCGYTETTEIMIIIKSLYFAWRCRKACTGDTLALWARWWEGEGRSDADTMRRCPLSSVGGSPRLRGGAVAQRAGEGRGWRCRSWSNPAQPRLSPEGDVSAILLESRRIVI